MKVERLNQIERLILEKGNVSFKQLQNHFDVSLNTLRRDINELVAQGKVEKVYGGVKAVRKIHELVHFEQREFTEHLAKVKIGKTAAALVESGDIIYIDSGTTTVQMLPYLPQDLEVTILTNNLDVIIAAANRPKVNLLVVGSKFKHSTRSFVDAASGLNLPRININKAFMATTGISLTAGLTNSDAQEQVIKSDICKASQQIILLADHTKFGHTALMTYADLKEISAVVTDRLEVQEQEFQDFFESHNIQVLFSEL